MFADLQNQSPLLTMIWAPTRLVSTILGVPNLQRIIVFLDYLFLV